MLYTNNTYLEIPTLNNIHDCIDSIGSQINSDTINYIYLKEQKYETVWELQKELHLLVKEHKMPDLVLFLEHKHVYTFGKNANEDFLLDSRAQEADVVRTDRGGQVTYHGPGQLIGYPIINLNFHKKSVSWFMRSLEKIIIDMLLEFNVKANRKDGYPGVWVEDEKVCAMGVRIAQWVTMHGFAINVDPDMKYFDGMIPCGILNHGVTSLKELTSKNIDNDKIIKILMKNFNLIFNRKNEI
jgi:lipoyl(octanoyl) transferase